MSTSLSHLVMLFSASIGLIYLVLSKAFAQKSICLRSPLHQTSSL